MEKIVSNNLKYIYKIATLILSFRSQLDFSQANLTDLTIFLPVLIESRINSSATPISC